MKKFILLTILLLGSISTTIAQTTGNGAGKAWVVLDSQYKTSPFNDTTKVDVYFDGSDYVGYITSVQFRIGYDGNAFAGVYDIQNRLGPDYILAYNDNPIEGQVLISIVYVGLSPVTTIPQGSMVTIRFQNIHPNLIYYNEPYIIPFNFSAYIPMGSNSDGLDVELGYQSYGGIVRIPHRRYTGYVMDIATMGGVPDVEYQLIKNSGEGMLGYIPQIMWYTAPDGFYEIVYYEDTYGTYVEGETTFSFIFNVQHLESDMALSSADAYTQLLYSINVMGYNPGQLLASDVNHSHTSTIADAYTLFGYMSSRFSGWQTFGHGGYGDVMFIHPNDVRFFTTDVSMNSEFGVGPLGVEPIKTEFIYNLADFNGQSDFYEDFYVTIMGDVNGTSLSSFVPMPKPIITDTVFIQLPTMYTSVGKFVNIPLLIRTGDVRVASFNFTVNYDPNVIQLVETSTTSLSNSWMFYFNTDMDGVVGLGGLDFSAGDFSIKNENYEAIANLKFKVLSETDSVPISFGSKNSIGNMSGEDVGVEVIGGELVISSTTGVGDEYSPHSIYLGDTFPNPFNPTTNIPVFTPITQHIKLEVFDVAGRMVKVVYDGVLTSGIHTFSFTADGLSSGLYIYRLTSSDNVVTKKMVLIK